MKPSSYHPRPVRCHSQVSSVQKPCCPVQPPALSPGQPKSALGFQAAPVSSKASSFLPQQASWRGVGEALEGRVLRAQEEGEDGSCASAQGVAYHN